MPRILLSTLAAIVIAVVTWPAISTAQVGPNAKDPNFAASPCAAGFTQHSVCATANSRALGMSQRLENHDSQTATSNGLPIDFARLFRGFDFVGSSMLSSPNPPHAVKESHPFPKTFDLGSKYFFHRRASTNGRSAFELLRSRLRELGINSRMSPLVAGSRFPTLEFESKGYAGTVIEIPHMQKSRSGKVSIVKNVFDYVLTIDKVEN